MLVAPSSMNLDWIADFLLAAYKFTSFAGPPGSVMGNVMRTVEASGKRVRKGSISSDLASKAKVIDPSLPFRVVAAYVSPRSSQSGIKRVESQPAPKMRMSTAMFRMPTDATRVVQQR
jgi:hypothetical protein